MWCDETVGPRQRDVIIHTTVVSIKRTIILFRHNNNIMYTRILLLLRVMNRNAISF